MPAVESVELPTLLRLLIADDHKLFRTGLRELLHQMPGLRVVAEAGSADEVVRALEPGGVDLVLLDLGMPGSVGTSLIGRIRRHADAPPVLVVSMRTELAFVTAALKAGAHGFVGKGCDLTVLVEAIHATVQRRHYVEPALAQRLVLSDPSTGLNLPHQKLTRREWQILQMVLQGRRLNEIADALFISAKTVSTHKGNLMRKLGVDSNADLIRYAMTHQLSG